MHSMKRLTTQCLSAIIKSTLASRWGALFIVDPTLTAAFPAFAGILDLSIYSWCQSVNASTALFISPTKEGLWNPKLAIVDPVQRSSKVHRLSSSNWIVLSLSHLRLYTSLKNGLLLQSKYLVIEPRKISQSSRVVNIVSENLLDVVYSVIAASASPLALSTRILRLTNLVRSAEVPKTPTYT